MLLAGVQLIADAVAKLCGGIYIGVIDLYHYLLGV
jgi:hypothetical protein